MKHVVSVSSGRGSAFTWKLALDRYGPENVVGVFTDVNGEHPDNYRFLAETQYHLENRLVKITNDGRNIWDVMKESRFLANTRVDVCSRILKREAMNRWLRDNCDPNDTTIHLGIDWTEVHRFERAKPLWAKAGWNIEAPMCESPYYDSTHAQAWLDEVGIKAPWLTRQGFTHANCGGGCVKAGIKQFKQLLGIDRWWYIHWWEKGEEGVRQYLGRDDIAILRDRRGGVTKPLTLRALREQVEVDKSGQLFEDEPEGPGCGVCFLGPSDEEETTDGLLQALPTTPRVA